MRRHAVIAGCLGIVLLRPGLAGAGDRESEAAALVASYRQIQRSHDPAVCHERRLLVERISGAGGATALRALRDVAEGDAEPLVRVAALEGLCRVGDPEDVGEALRDLRREAKRYEWMPLWVARSLGRAKDPGVGPWLASKLVAEGSGPVAVAMVRAVGALRCADAVAPLLKALRKSGAGERGVGFAFEVLRALGRIGGPEALAPVLEAAKGSDARLRMAAADTLLATEAGPASLEAMGSLLADASPTVRRAAATAVGTWKRKELRPALVDRLADPSRSVAIAAHDALAALDGKDAGLLPQDWMPKGATWAKRGEPPLERGRLPTDHALFLMDMSMSMGWPLPPNAPRLDLARDLMIEWLGKLPESAQFNLVEFASESSWWRKTPGKGRGQLPATPENVADAVRWLKGVKTHLLTHYDEILEAMQEDPEADTMYLVTDGRIQFDADDVMERFLVRLETANLFRRIPIHVTFVWWGPSKMPQVEGSWADLKPFVQSMATETGGTYREALQPPR